MRLRRSSSGLRTSESTQDFFPGQCLPQKDCTVCRVGLRMRHVQVASRIVASKYSASQNFFYSKDIADILDKRITRNMLLTGDLRLLDSPEENLGSLNSAAESLQLIGELTEYFKYYKDVPRIHMRAFTHIYRRHHDHKRVVEYNRLKAVLNLTAEQHQQLQAAAQPIVKQSLILKNIEFTQEATAKRNQSEQSSLSQLRQNLAKIVKPKRRNRRSTLQLIDRLYHFDQKQSPKHQQKKCSFQDISEIKAGNSQKQLCQSPTIPFRNMKKNTRARIGTGACSPLLDSGKYTHDRKRMSMDNIHLICLGSERSNDQRCKRSSQDDKWESNHHLKRSKSPVIGVRENKTRNRRRYLASTDTSYERPQTNVLQTPLPNDREACRRVATPGSSGKPKHLRVSSEQLEHRRSMNELPVAKSPKLKITINQNNIFNIMLGSKKELQKTPARPLKKPRR